MNKLLSVLFSVMMIFSMTSQSFAGELPKEEPQLIMVAMELDYENAVANEDGSITYDIVNLDELSSAWGINISDIKSAKYVAFNQDKEAYPSPQATITIKNVFYRDEACGTRVICRNQATKRLEKPVTKDITLTGTVSNSYSLDVESGVDVDVTTISAAVGFDVTESWSMSDNTHVDLEPGETITVEAFPLYEVYSFDVYQSSIWTGNEKVGSGDALQTVGFCTITY